LMDFQNSCVVPFGITAMVYGGAAADAYETPQTTARKAKTDLIAGMAES